jgi:hypothetical protein
MEIVVFAVIILAVFGLIAMFTTGSKRKGASMDQPVPDPTAGPCPNCGGPLSSIGVEHFRTGGTSGGWKLLFGEWAELGENMIDLEVLACPKCRRVEFRIPPN